MDFGDILKQWESRRSGESGKDGKEPDMNDLIDLYSPENAPRELIGKEIPPERRGKTHPRDLPVQAVLDLHGMTAEEAERELAAFLKASKAKGLRKVLIVHGKGNHSRGEPVLKRVVTSYLERCPFTGRTGRPGRSEGGSGAVWVSLR